MLTKCYTSECVHRRSLDESVLGKMVLTLRGGLSTESPEKNIIQYLNLICNYIERHANTHIFI